MAGEVTDQQSGFAAQAGQWLGYLLLASLGLLALALTSGSLGNLSRALYGVLAVVCLSPTADAQRGSRGDYSMVAGGVNGSDADAVYVINSSSQEIIAVTYERANGLTGVGYVNVGRDTARALNQRPNP